MFLPSGWLIAVLPPTDESTCASSVVGTTTATWALDGDLDEAWFGYALAAGAWNPTLGWACAVMALFTAKRGFGVDELGLSATAGHELDVIIDKLGVGDRVTPMVVEGQAAHVLVDAAVHAELLGDEPVDGVYGSDHFGLVADLRY